MLHLTAGSRFYIRNPSTYYEEAASRWVEIAGMESLGASGIDWETVEIPKHWGTDDEIVATHKNMRRSTTMQIAMALIDDDAGQHLLWEAAKDTHDTCFRLDIAPGISRFWEASVVSMGESYEAADDVVRRTATLAINSAIHPQEGFLP